MIDLFRIAESRHVRDLSGEGARLHGGRWNHKGVAVVYASESRSLAALESLAHLPAGLTPPRLRLTKIEIPGQFEPESVEIEALPRNWRSYPAPRKLADIGAAWVRSNRSLLLRVPSVLVNGEFNVLMNPGHPDIRGVKIVETVEHKFDQRLLR